MIVVRTCRLADALAQKLLNLCGRIVRPIRVRRRAAVAWIKARRDFITCSRRYVMAKRSHQKAKGWLEGMCAAHKAMTRAGREFRTGRVMPNGRELV